MKHRVIGSTTLLAAALLGGCSSAPVADGRLQIVPFERTRHAMGRAEAMYQTGRYYQGQVRYTHAIEAYRKALAENPDHVDALNALAVAHASLGQHAEAEQAFQQAIALAPDAAYLYNNLGYAYLRAGRIEEGQVALARALDLAPDNARYTANFAQATEALAELRRSQRALAQAARPDAGARDGGAPLRLEVANGNGIRGMAARTAGLLRQFGLPSARLTNDRPFRHTQTEIQYVAGRQDSAQQVSKLLPVTSQLVEMPALQRGIEVRVVIGHDLPDHALRRALREWPTRRAEGGNPA